MTEALRKRNPAALELLTTEEGCVLLDIQRDRILKLNTLAAEMWTRLNIQEPEQQIAASIAGKYKVSEERVLADISALQNRISQLGMQDDVIRSHSEPLDTSSSGAHSSAPWYGAGEDSNSVEPGISAVLAAFLGLLLFDLILSMCSLKALCACVRRWPARKNLALHGESVQLVCAAVHRACVWYPKRTLCLQRSAVTTCLLRSWGIPATMKIGFRPMPFMAHAWVEADGAVINDWPRVKKFYASLLSQ